MPIKYSTYQALGGAYQSARRIGKRTYLVLAALVAVAIITLFIAYAFLSRPTTFERAGLMLTNAEQLIEEAEAQHRAYLADLADVETLDSQEHTQCFLVLVGDTLTDKLACGVVRHPHADIGGYDIATITFSERPDGITAALEPGEWEPQGLLPAGAAMARPDGLQPLPGDLLTRPEVPAQPLPPETETVIVETYLPGTVRTEYIALDAPASIKTPERTVEVQGARLLDTVITGDGTEFKAPAGHTLLSAELVSTPTDDGDGARNVGEWFLEVGGQREPIELTNEKPQTLLINVPAEEVVKLVTVYDGVEQSVVISGPAAGERETPPEAEELYEEGPSDTFARLSGSRFLARESTLAEVEGLVSGVEKNFYAEGEGWGDYLTVYVSSLSNVCSADNQGGYIYGRSESDTPYDFSTVSVVVDGTTHTQPVVSTEDNGTYELLFEVASDFEVAEVLPSVSVNCEGTFWGTTDPYKGYQWKSPANLVGSIVADFTELEDVTEQPGVTERPTSEPAESTND